MTDLPENKFADNPTPDTYLDHGRLIETDPTKPGIELDSNGDPVRQGTLMIEKQSYERVVDGLRMSAEACRHLMKYETNYADKWRSISQKLDTARMICVQHAGLGMVMKEKETKDVEGEPMKWREARDRFREGLLQASGGLRQLATSFRKDELFALMSHTLEEIEEKLRKRNMMTSVKDKISPFIIMPENFN